MWRRFLRRPRGLGSPRTAPLRLGASVAGATLLLVPLLAWIGGAPVPTRPGPWIAMAFGAALLTAGFIGSDSDAL
jgi:hypothetical protein